jgi:hypothetical protein
MCRKGIGMTKLDLMEKLGVTETELDQLVEAFNCVGEDLVVENSGLKEGELSYEQSRRWKERNNE